MKICLTYFVVNRILKLAQRSNTLLIRKTSEVKEVDTYNPDYNKPIWHKHTLVPESDVSVPDESCLSGRVVWRGGQPLVQPFCRPNQYNCALSPCLCLLLLFFPPSLFTFRRSTFVSSRHNAHPPAARPRAHVWLRCRTSVVPTFVDSYTVLLFPALPRCRWCVWNSERFLPTE